MLRLRSPSDIRVARSSLSGGVRAFGNFAEIPGGAKQQYGTAIGGMIPDTVYEDLESPSRNLKQSTAPPVGILNRLFPMLRGGLARGSGGASLDHRRDEQLPTIRRQMGARAAGDTRLTRIPTRTLPSFGGFSWLEDICSLG